MLLQQSVESYSFFTWNLLCLHLSLSPIQCTHTQIFSIVTHILKYPLVAIFLSWGLKFFSPTFFYLRGYSAHDNDRWPPNDVTSRRYIHRLLPVSHQWQIPSEGCSVLLFYFIFSLEWDWVSGQFPKWPKLWIGWLWFYFFGGIKKNPPKKIKKKFNKI